MTKNKSAAQKNRLGVFVVYGSIFVSGVLSFLISVFMVRILSKMDFGTTQFIFKINDMVTLFVALGLNAAAMRFIPEFMAQGKEELVNKLSFIIIGVRTLGLFLFVSALWLFLPWFTGFFNQPAGFSDNFILIVFLVFFYGIIPLLRVTFFSSFFDEYKAELIQVLRLLLAFAGLAMIWWRGVSSLRTVLLVFVFAYGVVFVLYAREGFFKIRANKKQFVGKEKLSFGQELKKRIVHYTAYNVLNTTAGILKNVAVDVFVISHFLGNEPVANYAIALFLISTLNQFNPSERLKNIFNPAIFKKFAQSQRDNKILGFYGNLITKVAFFVIMPFLALLGILGEKVITLVYKESYLDAVTALRIFCAFFVCKLVFRRYQILFHALERNELIFWSSFLGIINLILSLILVRPFGINGVAFSTGFTWFLTLLFYVVMSRYFLKIRFRISYMPFARHLLNIAILSGFFLFCQSRIHNVFHLIFVALTGIIIYGVLSHFNPMFDPDERREINRLLNRNVCVF